MQTCGNAVISEQTLLACIAEVRPACEFAIPPDPFYVAGMDTSFHQQLSAVAQTGDTQEPNKQTWQRLFVTVKDHVFSVLKAGCCSCCDCWPNPKPQNLSKRRPRKPYNWHRVAWAHVQGPKVRRGSFWPQMVPRVYPRSFAQRLPRLFWKSFPGAESAPRGVASTQNAHKTRKTTYPGPGLFTAVLLG